MTVDLYNGRMIVFVVGGERNDIKCIECCEDLWYDNSI